MKIRNTIRRKAGSSQTIDGVTYRWNDENDHVCEVDNPAHANKLLSLKGWEAENEGGSPGETQPSADPAEQGQGDDAGQAEDSAAQKPVRGRRKKAENEGGAECSSAS